MTSSSYSPLKYAVLLLTILVCLGQAVMAEPTSSIRTTDRWVMGDSFHYELTLKEPTPASTFEFEIRIYHQTLEISPLYISPTCYVKLDSLPDAIPVTITPASDGFSIQFELDDDITFHHVYWTCQELVLIPPPQVSGSVEIDFLDKVTLNGNVLKNGMITQYDIYNAPGLKHEFLFDRIDSNAVAIDVTFFRPPNYPGTSFDIRHPFLEVDQMTAMHAPSIADFFVDWIRPYFLFAPSSDNHLPITCKGQYGEPDSTISLITPDGDAQKPILQLVMPSIIQTTIDYHCTFTLHFAPELITPISKPYSLTFHDTDTREAFKSTVYLPPFIPRVLPSSTPSPADMVPIWITPQYEQSATQFEFSLLTLQRYINRGNGEPIFQSIPEYLEIQIAMDTREAGSLEEWSPVIACRDVMEFEFPESTPVPDGRIYLTADDYSLGKTCRITLTARPDDVPATGSVQLFFKTNDDTPCFITQFDAMNQAKNRLSSLHLLDTSAIDVQQLPVPDLIPLTKSVEDGNTYAVAKMNIQSLLPYRPIQQIHASTIDLVFPDLHDLTIFGGQSATVKTSLKYRDYAVTTDLEETVGTFTTTLNTLVPTDSLQDTFQPGKPVRAPSISIPIPADFDPTIVAELTVKILIESSGDVDVDVDVEVESLRMLPTIFPGPTRVYSPQLALITPVRPTPLTGYSYRCVTWDKMAAPYLLGDVKLNDDNSFPCPSHISATGEVDVSDSSIWRKREHDHMDPYFYQPLCLFEVAAVCVTPSATVEGEYVAHPLADCPSFLGETHAVPCSLVDEETPTWDYAFHGDFNGIIGPSPFSSAPALVIGWGYRGDPRLTMSVLVRGFKSSQDDEEREALPWIALSVSHLPHLSPSMMYDGSMLPAPLLGDVDSLEIMITLNGFPDVKSSVIIGYAVPDQFITGCDAEGFKLFDPLTHLCGCAKGYQADIPTGVLNPFVQPDAFACLSICKDGYTWNPDSEACENGGEKEMCYNHGVFDESSTQCYCFDDFFGNACEYSPESPQGLCRALDCVADNTVEGNECVVASNPDSSKVTATCNCLSSFYGDKCQYEHACAYLQTPCEYGLLSSSDGTTDKCECKCSNAFISGVACDTCELPCQNKGVPNASCTVCECPDGFTGDYCQIPAWNHRFKLEHLSQTIADLINDATSPYSPDAASSRARLAPQREFLVNSLLSKYNDALEQFALIIAGTDKAPETVSLEAGVTAAKYVGGETQGENNGDDNAALNTASEPHILIEFTLRPRADVTEETIARMTKNGIVDPDWTPITSSFDELIVALKERDIITDETVLRPTIEDPGCMNASCRDDEKEDSDDDGENNDDSDNAGFTVMASASAIVVMLISILALA